MKNSLQSLFVENSNSKPNTTEAPKISVEQTIESGQTFIGEKDNLNQAIQGTSKSSVPCYYCCCWIFIVIFILLSSVFGVAFFTDTELPIVSSITDSIKEAAGKNTLTVAKVERSIREGIMKGIVPLFQKNKNFFNIFLSSSVSKDYLEDNIRKYEEINSFYTEGTISVIWEENGENSNTEIKIDASVKPKESDFDLDMSITGEVGKDEYNHTIEVIDKEEISYFKYLGSFSVPSELKSYRGKWISLSAQDTENLLEIINLDLPDPKSFDDESFEKISEFLSKAGSNSEFSQLADQNIKGELSMCGKLTYDSNALGKVSGDYERIFGSKLDPDLINNLQNLEIGICIGKESKSLRKIQIVAQFADGYKLSSANAEFSFWGYDEDFEIKPPLKFTPFETITEEISLIKLFLKQN